MSGVTGVLFQGGPADGEVFNVPSGDGITPDQQTLEIAVPSLPLATLQDVTDPAQTVPVTVLRYAVTPNPADDGPLWIATLQP